MMDKKSSAEKTLNFFSSFPACNGIDFSILFFLTAFKAIN